MKSKLLSFMLTMLLAMLAWGLSAQASEEGSLLIWMRADKPHRGMTELGKKFEKDLGVPVKVEFPDGAIEKFIQSAQAGKGPDLFGWAHDRVGDIVASGLLLPLDMDDNFKKKINNKALDAFSLGGKLYAYPVGMEAIAMIYNKDIVKEEPKDFNDIIALHQQLQKDNSRAKALIYDYNNFYFSYPFLAANGGYVFGRKADGDFNPTDVGLNNDGAVKGVEFIAQMVKDGVMPKGAGYSIMVSNMVKGRLAFMISGPWEWSNLDKRQVNYGVMPLPPLNGAQPKPFIGVQGFMVSRVTKNKDLIKEFMENYVLTEEGMKVLNDDTPVGVPALNSYAEQLAKDPRIAATRTSIEQGDLMPNIPEMNKVWTNVFGIIGDVVNGRISAKEALDRSVSKIK